MLIFPETPSSSLSFQSIDQNCLMVLLSWKWAWIIKAVICIHIFLRNVLLLYSWQLPKRRLHLAEDERSQWDPGVVPQCCISVEILLSRIQMFLLLLRDVYSHILQYHQPLVHAFHVTRPDLYFSGLFSWGNTETFGCSGPTRANLVSSATWPYNLGAPSSFFWIL